MKPNSALLTDAFSALRCACGAAKRERYVAVKRASGDEVDLGISN
jgi:hypothetical protein